LMRPVFFEEQDNKALMDVKDTYLWGDAFLVKPITEPGQEEVAVNLPKGVWFDYWDDTKHLGGQTIKLQTSLERLPVLVRAGSFVPMVAPVQSSDDYSTETLQLHYYADNSVKNAHGIMYDDDGINPNSIANNEFETLSFSALQKAKTLQIELSKTGNYLGMPQKRELTFIVHNWQTQPTSILLGNASIKQASSASDFASTMVEGNNKAYWDQNSKQFKVKFAWQDDVRLSIK